MEHKRERETHKYSYYSWSLYKIPNNDNNEFRIYDKILNDYNPPQLYQTIYHLRLCSCLHRVDQVYKASQFTHTSFLIFFTLKTKLICHMRLTPPLTLPPLHTKWLQFTWSKIIPLESSEKLLILNNSLIAFVHLFCSLPLLQLYNQTLPSPTFHLPSVLQFENFKRKF